MKNLTQKYLTSALALCFSVLTCAVTGSFAQVTADFTPKSVLICKDSCIQFTDKSSYTGDPITVWNWTFDGGIPSSFIGQNPPPVCYNSPGTFRVSLYVSNGSSQDVLNLLSVVTVSQLSAAFSISPTTVCTGSDVTVTYLGNASPNATYQWDFDGGTAVSDTGRGPHTVSSLNSGSNTISLTVNDSGCSATSSATVTVSPLVTASVTISPNSLTICPGSSAAFTAIPVNGGSAPSYQWKINGNNVGTNSMIFSSSTLNNNDVVSCVMTSSSLCVSGSPATSNFCVVTVNNCTLTPNFTSSVSSTCNCVIYADTSTGGATPYQSWRWSFTGGTPSSYTGENPPEVCYNAPGNYPVKLIVTDNNGVTDSIVQTVTVHDCLPHAAFFVSQNVICEKDCIHYTDLSTNNPASWSWTFDGGTPQHSNLQNPTNICYDTSGIYNVRLTVANANGADTTIMVGYIKVNTCSNGCAAGFTLAPDNNNPHTWYALNTTTGVAPITYLWNWGDGSTSPGATPSHTYSAPGFYKICVTITDGAGCTSTFCNSSVYLFRTEDASPVTVNVVNSFPNGVSAVSADQMVMKIYPVPCTTCEIIGVENPKDLIVTDVLGRNVPVAFSKSSAGYLIQLSIDTYGIYIVRNRRTGEVVKFIKE